MKNKRLLARSIAVGVAVAAAAAVSTLHASAVPVGLANDHAVVAGAVPAWASPSTRVGDASDSEQRTVQVGLALRNAGQAEDLARQVSTPGEANFGRFLSSQEFTRRFAASERTADEVRTWLTGSGLRVREVASNRRLVTVTGSVRQLEATFHTSLAVFQPSGGSRMVAPERPISVPARLRGSIIAVTGLDDSATLAQPASTQNLLKPAAKAAADSTFCSRWWGDQNNTAVPQKYPAGSQSNRLCGYTPAQVRAMYGQGAANTGAGVDVAITGAYNLTTAEADTNRWAAQFGGTPLAAGQYRVVPPPDGYRDNPNCDAPAAWNGEQALDLQAVHTMAPAASVTWYAGADCTELYGALNRAIAANTATVISNSWGSLVGDAMLPQAARDQMGAMLVQAAIQGQSVLFSTGDTGDGTGTVSRGVPQFPASHPWATAVGGTSVGLGQNNSVLFTTGWESSGNTLVGGQWQAQSDADGSFAGGAGGGRSGVFAQPSYQRGVVPDAYAQGRRTVPDISALGDVYTGFTIGLTTSQGWVYGASGGTSLASPLMAGLTANAQQARGARLGFLNGALYAMRSNTAAVVDVTHRAAGVWTPRMPSFGGVTVPTNDGDFLIDFDTKPQSIQSGPGWDPVTGVGTPVAGFVAALARR